MITNIKGFLNFAEKDGGVKEAQKVVPEDLAVSYVWNC